jgi:hypothetical protein
MVTPLREFIDKLKSRNYRGLEFQVHYFEEETHFPWFQQRSPEGFVSYIPHRRLPRPRSRPRGYRRNR